uniref:Uncharacterized protein n=1 Tax=Anguilla anguilla TaxID=7936 RepID=A0A0E9W687_ANGAN
MLQSLSCLSCMYVFREFSASYIKFNVGPETNIQRSKLTNLDKDVMCSARESQPQINITQILHSRGTTTSCSHSQNSLCVPMTVPPIRISLQAGKHHIEK